MIDPETGWDDLVWRPGAATDANPPLTITGILRDAAKPQPLRGTSLSLLMNDQQMADAGITPAGQAGQSGPMVAAADKRAYDGLCRLPDGSVHPYTDAGGGYVDVYGGGNPDSNGQAGVGEAASETAAPTSPKRGGVGGGGPSGKVTSPASRAARGLTGSAKVRALEPITRAVSETGTMSVGGAIGRAIPLLSGPLMWFDVLEHQNAPDCVPVQDPTAVY